MAPAKGQRTQDGQESIGARTSHDQQIWTRVGKLVEEFSVSPQEMLGNFPAYARRVHLTRFLVHYEIFRRVQDLPGSVVELGVFRGSSLLTFAKLLEIFAPGDRSRKVIGFDHFRGLHDFSPKDGPQVEGMGKTKGGWSAAAFEAELLENIAIFHDDSFIPRAPRVEMVLGDIGQTVPDYVASNPGLRLSLLHFDSDLYEPTKVGLEQLYPLVVRGGVVLFDEYGVTEWAGESAAVDDYFHDKDLTVRKLPLSSTPGGFVIKP